MMMLRCALFVLLTGSLTLADDWPQFLGPNRTGQSAETGLLKAWPAGGPEELWRAECRGGLSGVVVSGGLAYTMVQNEGEQAVAAFDAGTGDPRWQTALGPAYRNQQGNGPRATPTVHDGVLYAYTGDGTLAALQAATGDVIWKSNLLSELGGKPADYGMASSPLRVGELVVVTTGVKGACLIACDAKSGTVVWKTGDDRAGYSSPAVMTLQGKQQIVAFTGSSAWAVSPKDGSRLWTHPFETDYDCNTANPVLVGDRVLISSGENHGTSLLQPGKNRATEVWSSHGPRAVLRAEWQTPVLIDGYLYGLDNVGSAGPVTHLTCIRADTGERVWQQRRFGKGNLIAADGKLFLTTMKGDLVVVEATPDSYKELGRHRYVGMTRQAPALADGRLYLRDERELVCLKIK